jgi:hypothetical protein
MTTGPTTSHVDQYPTDDIETFRQMPLVDKLDNMRRRIIGEETVKLEGTPTFDTDQLLRCQALAAAVTIVSARNVNSPDFVIEFAERFTVWLRDGS